MYRYSCASSTSPVRRARRCRSCPAGQDYRTMSSHVRRKKTRIPCLQENRCISLSLSLSLSPRSLHYVCLFQKVQRRTDAALFTRRHRRSENESHRPEEDKTDSLHTFTSAVLSPTVRSTAKRHIRRDTIRTCRHGRQRDKGRITLSSRETDFSLHLSLSISISFSAVSGRRAMTRKSVSVAER